MGQEIPTSAATASTEQDSLANAVRTRPSNLVVILARSASWSVVCVNVAPAQVGLSHHNLRLRAPRTSP